MKARLFVCIVVLCCICSAAKAEKRQKVYRWNRFETTLVSAVAYADPLSDIILNVIFTSPSGKQYTADGFWNGGADWKIRFMPDETGRWSYRTYCSDEANSSLHNREGTFDCRKNRSSSPIYSKGRIGHRTGDYHLSYADGTPFFYLGCTAWNGAIRSTDDEWERYLQHRAQNSYTAIQFITTQWRGLPEEAIDEVAFTGNDTITINPVFFQRLDEKIDRVNRMGLVAAPVMLWAWGSDNPGVYLPVHSAVKLAKYIKARYDSYHVIWNLGGDGQFTGQNEARWKEIGRAVFGSKDGYQNVVTLHAAGFRWYGNDYDGESWLDMISYQTGHANSESAVRWKTRGPVASNWMKLTPRPIIDTEPVYEAQGENGNDYEVRKSILWSVFSAPVAGVGYGAWSTWPWLRVGEKSYNHGMKEPSKYTWEDGINSKGSIQVGKLRRFFEQFEWWKFKPVYDRLISQSGNDDISNTISVLADPDANIFLVYIPVAQTIRLKNEEGHRFDKARWYYPEMGNCQAAEITYDSGSLETVSQSDTDAILVLE